MPPKKKTGKVGVPAPQVVVVQAARKKKGGRGGGGGGGGGPKITGRTVGSAIGGWIGNAASTLLGKITGLGDYVVSKNSILGTSPPQFMMGGGCVRIAHREFLGLVTSPGGTFTIISFPLNPFNAVTFPWLSELAASFETFQFKGVVFEFKSTYGDAIASTNAALGSVILATQYNSTAPAFNSQLQMENYQFATSCKPSISMVHPIECDPSQLPMEHLYVYNQNSVDQDPRWSTLGVTYLATVGQQAAATLGELWCSYEIEFYQPKLLSGVSSNGLGGHLLFTSSLTTASMSSTNFLANFPSTPSSWGGDLVMTSDAVNNLFFPQGLSGYYLVTVRLSSYGGTSANNPAPNNSNTPTVSNGTLVGFASTGNNAQTTSVYSTTIATSNSVVQMSVTNLVHCTPTTSQTTSLQYVSGCFPVWGNNQNSTFYVDVYAVAVPFSS